MVKNLPAMQETRVQSLGQEDPLVKGMATHSSILAWRIPWTEEPGGLQSMGSQRVRYNWATNRHNRIDTVLWLGLPWWLRRAQTVKNLPAVQRSQVLWLTILHVLWLCVFNFRGNSLDSYSWGLQEEFSLSKYISLFICARS